MHDALVTAVYINDDLVRATWQPGSLCEWCCGGGCLATQLFI